MKKTIKVWTVDYFEEEVDVPEENLAGKEGEEADEVFEDAFLEKWSDNEYDSKGETKVYFEKDDEFGLIQELVDMENTEGSLDEGDGGED